MYYIPPRCNSSSLCLPVNVHPLSTVPSCAFPHSGMYTRTHMHGTHTQAHLSVPFQGHLLSPQHGYLYNREMDETGPLLRVLYLRKPSLLGGRDWFSSPCIHNISWPSRLLWHHPRQPSTFQSLLCKGPSFFLASPSLGLRATSCLCHPDSRL